MLTGTLAEADYRRQAGFLEGAYSIVKLPARVEKELTDRALERQAEKEDQALEEQT